MAAAKPKVKEQEGGFSKGLKEYGKWHEKWGQRIDMDRFVTLVFLTAEEKIEFCKKFLGKDNERACYVDGAGVELKLKPNTRIA